MLFNNVRGFWGAVGLGGALIAIYLVLQYGDQSVKLGQVSFGGAADLVKSFQGR